MRVVSVALAFTCRLLALFATRPTHRPRDSVAPAYCTRYAAKL